MNYRTTLIALSSFFLLYGGLAAANGGAETTAPEAQAGAAADAEALPAQAESAYKQALEAAQKSREAARAALTQAQQTVAKAAERRREALSERQAERIAEQRELMKMREALNNAHRQLRETSRQVARLSREIALAGLAESPVPVTALGGERPVIGVILGRPVKDGVTILGVSPDGPADRAGIKADDVIVAIGKHELAGSGGGVDLRDRLRDALKDMKAEEALNVTVRRGDKTLKLEVVPKVREPLAWQSVIRIPSVPEVGALPNKQIVVERLDIPDIDTDALRLKIDKLRAGVDKRRALIDAGLLKPSDKAFKFRIDTDDLSELGDFALQDVNAWFGIPLTDGLQLAAIDPELGQYFKTDRGVLVLKAKPDNQLKLHTGDVVLDVGKAAVNSPADLIRALRGYKPDDELELAIKRERKNRTLKVKIPKHDEEISSAEGKKAHTITITSKTD